MANNVVSIAVQANSTQLQTAFDQGASSAERFKAKMGLVAKAVVAALAIKAAQAITDFVGDSVEAFSDLNESLNAVEVTFGENAEGIKKLGEEAARSLGLSNAEFNSFAVQMSAFAHEIAGDGGDVIGVVDELSTRVADFASVMNLEVNEAARLFQSGLAGETEPLRRYGIDLSAAAVTAHALATGISDGSGELSEQEKILSRHSLLMEQTEKTAGDFANTADDYANAQRIANAEMENAKARVGELLVPFAQLTTQVKALGAETLSQLALGFQQITGQISETDEAIGRFELSTGSAADTAEAAVTIAKEYGISFDELIPRLDLSREELEKLRDADEDFLESMGFTEDQVNDLADAVELDLASSLTVGEQAARDAFAANQEYEGGLEEVEEQVEDTTSALEKHIGIMQESHDQLRAQIDPLFALRDAQRDVEAAQLAVNEAIEEHGEGSPEHLDALEDQTDAFLDLEQANIDVRAAGGLTREEFVNQQIELGHTREAAELLADKFEDLENFEFEPKIISLKAQLDRSGVPSGFFGAVPQFHEGGEFRTRTPGGEGLALLKDRERIIPAGHGNGGGDINITIHAGLGTNGHDLGELIVEEIVRARRRGVNI